MGTIAVHEFITLEGIIDGRIYVSVSGTPARAMLADGLVELAGCDVFDNGALHLNYRTAPPERRG